MGRWVFYCSVKLFLKIVCNREKERNLGPLLKIMHRVRQECIFQFRSQKGKTCTLGLSTSVRGASTGNHSFHVRRDFSCLSLNKIGRMILILCRMCSEIPVWSGKGAPADQYLCLKHCVIMAMLYLTEVVFLFLSFPPSRLMDCVFLCHTYMHWSRFGVAVLFMLKSLTLPLMQRKKTLPCHYGLNV